MLTFYDYGPSQNGWKVRQILHHLAVPHRRKLVSIFEGAGQDPAYRRVNPWGAVPALDFGDGRVLSESNAILFHLARGSIYLPDDAFAQAKMLQWLSFEADYVQATIGSLRYWTLTGKLDARPPEMIAGKRAAGTRALDVLDQQLAASPFILGDAYSIADISLYAYGAHAEEAGLPLHGCAAVRAWKLRVEAQPGFLAERFPYDEDPHSRGELP